MKTITHTLITCKDLFEGPVQERAFQLAFEWANKVGREGRMVGGLHIETAKTNDPLSLATTHVNCIEVLTDDDYNKLATNKEIKSAEETKKKEPLESEFGSSDNLIQRPGSEKEEKTNE